MSQTQQLQQTPATTAQPSWVNDDKLLESACKDQSGDVIRQLREGATIQYKVTKRTKQEELSYRVNEAKSIGKNAFKNAKKKVDNHASSVASRSRRVYLISNYEALVRNTMAESAHLARFILHLKSLLADREADIRRVHMKNNALTRENDLLRAQLSKNQSSANIPPANSLNQENNWTPDFAIDSLPYDTNTLTASTSRFIQLETAQMNSLDRTDMQGVSFDDEQSNEVNAYLQRVAEQSSTDALPGVDSCLKMENVDWGPLPVINFKDAQAQMKADTPDNVLHPAV